MPLAFTSRCRILLAVLALSGCASAPEARFYTLSGGEPLAAERADAAQPRYSVAVGPVKVPEIVDRPQLVIREGGNRVALTEQHRWAQPLRAEIARALAADLGQRLPQARVAVSDEYAARDPDCRVMVDIERFDATPGDAVAVQALWTVRCASPAATRTGRSAMREPVGAGGFDAIAQAYGRALSAMSAEIADAVASLRAPGA